MQLFRSLVFGCFAFSLTGCGAWQATDRAAALLGARDAPVAEADGWTVLDLRVDVPRSLSVSEADRYYPRADIVWREDPAGNRYEQVAQILDDGLSRGLTHLSGPRQVYADVTVQRFHSLTQKARYTTGGVHRIVFSLRVLDAATGEVLFDDPRVALNIKALGGSNAFEAERRGLTQKVRIKGYLAQEMQRRFGGDGASTPRFVLEAAAAAAEADLAAVANDEAG